MKTKVVEIMEIDHKAEEELKEAAGVLQKGGLVAFPTETVYGLGADALNGDAVKKIYLAKGRPSDNPIIAHIADVSILESLTPAKLQDVEILAENFWPGPLTVVLPKRPQVPDATTGGLSTVAVRMPDNPIALELIRQSGRPIAAPSANISGRPSPTKGDHVVQDLMGRVDVIIKSGDCRVGIESTVLDMTGPVPVILRPGILTPEQLSGVLQKEVVFDPGILSRFENEQGPDGGEPPGPKSPGMKYTHYAPKAEMLILRGEPAEVKREIERLRSEKEQAGVRVGTVLFEDKAFEKAAHDFFSMLRELDDQGVDLILAGALNDRDSLGLAVMNRMLKAAGHKVIDVR